jgi:mRNA interferase RelE/StbE
VRYAVEVTDAALRTLRGLPKRVRARLWERIGSLAEDPRPPGCKALQGALRGSHRVRVGSYRIIYRIEADRLVVVVVEVGTRGDVYGRARRRA